MRSPRRRRFASTARARRGVSVSSNSADTRSVAPPCRLPLNVARAQDTTSYGEAAAEAAHRAVNAETFSSWSAQSTNAVRIALAAVGPVRFLGAQAACRARWLGACV